MSQEPRLKLVKAVQVGYLGKEPYPYSKLHGLVISFHLNTKQPHLGVSVIIGHPLDAHNKVLPYLLGEIGDDVSEMCERLLRIYHSEYPATSTNLKRLANEKWRLRNYPNIPNPEILLELLKWLETQKGVGHGTN